MIGTLGNVIFNVSENDVKTFSDLSFSHQESYAEHKILNGPGLLEYTGSNATSCTLKISLNASSGTNPKQEIKTLREILQNHQAVDFILGGEVQGRGQWVIESMSESLNIIGSSGEIISAEVNLNLKEYIP